jgi:hypothetical protein
MEKQMPVIAKAAVNYRKVKILFDPWRHQKGSTEGE